MRKARFTPNYDDFRDFFLFSPFDARSSYFIYMNVNHNCTLEALAFITKILPRRCVDRAKSSFVVIYMDFISQYSSIYLYTFCSKFNGA